MSTDTPPNGMGNFPNPSPKDDMSHLDPLSVAPSPEEFQGEPYTPKAAAERTYHRDEDGREASSAYDSELPTKIGKDRSLLGILRRQQARHRDD